MTRKFKYSGLILAIAISMMFVANGCESNDSPQTSENTDTIEARHDEHGHEGHDHGPGEHGLVSHDEDHDTAELDWCAEHFVPESQCTQCNPLLIAAFKESGDWCAGHDLPESHCRLCNPGIEFPQEIILREREMDFSESEIEVSLFFRPNADICATNDALIQFASVETVERAGITIQSLRGKNQEAVIEAPAEIVFDETQSNVINTTVSALVSRWLVSPGDIVRHGEVMAILQSPEIARLKSKLISDYSHYQVEQKELARHKEMRKRDLISEADYDSQEAMTEKAKSDFISTKGLLLAAGLNDRDIESILDTKNVSAQYALRAPTSGMVVERIAQLGQLHDAGEAFALMADPQAMWIEAQLTEANLKTIDIGQRITFVSDGRSLNQVSGEIIWISRFLDPHTRTGTVRARVLDENHNLHAGEFGRVKIVHSGPKEVTLVPKDAVQWEGCCNVVFVKETDDRYRPRKVNLIDGEEQFYQVLDGVKPGEQVVVEGAYLLKTELKKSSIGAGCCGLEPTS